MIPGAIIIILMFTFFFKLICQRKRLNDSIDLLQTIETPEPPKKKTVSVQTVITIKNLPPSSLDEPSTSKISQCNTINDLPKISPEEINGHLQTVEFVEPMKIVVDDVN